MHIALLYIVYDVTICYTYMYVFIENLIKTILEVFFYIKANEALNAACKYKWEAVTAAQILWL